MVTMLVKDRPFRLNLPVRWTADRAFHCSLDALIVVDLLHGDPATLTRYFGAEGLAAFRAHHEQWD